MTPATHRDRPDGREPGFRDGPAATARFNSPTSVAVVKEVGVTYVFVSDSGNRRIRRIVIP